MTDYKSSPLPPDASSTAPPPKPKEEPGQPADGEKKKKGHWWIWALAILVLAIGVWYYFRQKSAADAAAAAKAAAAPHAVPVVTATARKGSMGDYVEALGTVTPVYTVSVTARVQGQIVAVHYREGQSVRKGDPLVDIDPRPYQAVLTQTQGQLARDQALLAEAKIDLDRYQQALDQKAIAEQQVYDQQQLVKQYEGTVENDQGMVAAAQVNLTYCHITSPIDGRVGLRLVDPGNVVQAGSTTPLVVVTQLQPITVIFNVAEDYLPQIQKGTKNGNHLSVDALDRTQESKIASGTVTAVGNQIDTTTGTVDLRATFANTDLALFPNQFVNAKLLLDTENGVTLVPSAAVQRNAQGAFVYVIANQKATVRNITVGTTDATSSVVQGVNPGEVVAVNGFDKLQDGISVTITQQGKGRGAGGTSGGASGSSSSGQASTSGGSSP
jgi:multidrug efflux system membrane fusion protein